MKKFLVRGMFFILPLIVLFIGFEVSLRQIPNPYTFKDQLMERKSGEIKTLIIGSSVADYGIFPAYLGDSAYSLSISGEWNKYNELSLMRYFDRMTNLKYIVWGICFQALWCDDDYVGVFVREHEIADVTKKADQLIYRRIYTGKYNPKYEIESIQNINVAIEKWKKHYLLRKPTVRCDSLGYDYSYALTERDPEWKETLEYSLKRHTANIHSEVAKKVYQLNYNRMLRVAQACQRRGIKLYLVVPPTHSLYYTNVNKEQLQLMYDALKGICREYDNAYFLNYFNDSRFVDDDFFDVNHLSDVGAKKFTILLRDEVLEMQHE